MNNHTYKDEALCVKELLGILSQSPDLQMRIEAQARAFVTRIRDKPLDPLALEHILHEYALDKDEGVALMTLAEALLRIPDAATAKALIKDKIGAAEWFSENTPDRKRDWLLRASSLGLSLSKKTLDSLLAKVGEPFIYRAMMQAMRIISKQFILGETIEDALHNAKTFKDKQYSVSYDMLGEGARTSQDAEKYFKAYKDAIAAIAETTKKSDDNRSGISVKLSALYPRFEFSQKDRCFPALTEKLLDLAQDAARHNLSLIIDAEEHERLHLSLDIIKRVFSHRSLKDWDGFGLAVQAYRKDALIIIDHLIETAEKEGKKLHIRLVKGAYWDTEIKQAQIKGLKDYPVYTRKANTDLSYLACAKKLLDNRDLFYPLFATHNAQTAAAILEMAGKKQNDFCLQRLHGMGDALFDIIQEDNEIPISLYAPVGIKRELLPYLVRRLLENGANNSFVHQVHDTNIPIKNLIAHPIASAIRHKTKKHDKIPMPEDLYGENRKNSSGIDLSIPDIQEPFLTQLGYYEGYTAFKAQPLIGGEIYTTHTQVQIRNPSNWKTIIGEAEFADTHTIELAFKTAKEGFETWSEETAEKRAQALEHYADLLEQHRIEFISLCIKEAGKTIQDSIAEVREAIDFCRYYAAQGRYNFAEKGIFLPAPDGEENRMLLQGRGIFICISPWNFPLAIFTGQIAAALMAGNSVIAKPAEQTPLIAMKATQLMHEAGIHPNALNLLPGDGQTGATLIEHKDVAGVAFTGSTKVAHLINRALAIKNGPIIPFIAETGGQNALISDSSALAEQLVDDVITSAFGSAGQRCSALRVLFLQQDCAEKIIEMISGAMQELRIDNPKYLSTDIGPLIETEAQEHLTRHVASLGAFAKKLGETPFDKQLAAQGYFFPPSMYEIKDMDSLTEEVFGPVLHVIRYRTSEIDDVIKMINETGYGLTLGIHTRIEEKAKKIMRSVRAGNIYLNRSIVGAIVGSQPFGGEGLSGTGPKAGGPLYLPRFATERTISTNSMASGGNASLLTVSD